MIATDAGGTAELAPGNPAMRVLARDAAPAAIAEAVVDLAIARPEGGRALVLAGFTRERMAERYAALYRRAVAPAPRAGGGIALITNNFSTGGAQSSARRLLAGLAAEGARPRRGARGAGALPTPGRAALLAAGIPVFAAPTAGTSDTRPPSRRSSITSTTIRPRPCSSGTPSRSTRSSSPTRSSASRSST